MKQFEVEKQQALSFLKIIGHPLSRTRLKNILGVSFKSLDVISSELAKEGKITVKEETLATYYVLKEEKKNGIKTRKVKV